jgi:hypothetical protein
MALLDRNTQYCVVRMFYEEDVIGELSAYEDWIDTET